MNNESLIYFISDKNGGPIKIGYTSKNPKNRLKSLQTGNPNVLHIMGLLFGSERDEMDLHSKFDSLRLSGEWFKREDILLEFIKVNTFSEDDLKNEYLDIIKEKDNEIFKLKRKIDALKKIKPDVEALENRMVYELSNYPDSAYRLMDTLSTFMHNYFQFNKGATIEDPNYMWTEFHKDLRKLIQHSFDLDWRQAQGLINNSENILEFSDRLKPLIKRQVQHILKDLNFKK